jgi:GcrA cell cycle regulator
MDWTQERVELLTKLWNDGLSASLIAFELGGITRNAVIGKVHRIGLSGRPRSPSESARPRKIRSSRAMRAPRIVNGPAPAPQFEPDAEPETELLEIPQEQRRTLLQLTDAVCHWPVGDPTLGNFFFCGASTADRKTTYCPYHDTIAHLPYINRRRELRPAYR